MVVTLNKEQKSLKEKLMGNCEKEDLGREWPMIEW